MMTAGQRRYKPASPAQSLAIVASDGCVLHLRVMHKGDAADQPPVLFVHALAMNGDMWHGVAQALARTPPLRGHAFYALDCRGHGRSQSTAGGFSTRQFAEDLVAVIDALGAEKAHVVGCSMGGTVALSLARNFPHRIASLTVIDCSAWYGPEAPTHWEKRAQTALSGGMPAMVDFQLARWFSPDFLEKEPQLVREALEVFIANPVAAYANSCRMLGRADEREGLSKFGGPVAVVVGDADYATPPAMAELIASRMPGAKLTVIGGTRHYTPLEAPETVAHCIQAAMARWVRSGSPPQSP